MIFFSFIIFIFITINHIISLKQKTFFTGHVSLKFSLRLLLSFFLIFFASFSLVLLLKVLVIKKHVYCLPSCSNIVHVSLQYIVTVFLYLLFGYVQLNFGLLTKGEPYLADVHHCIITFLTGRSSGNSKHAFRTSNQ